MRRKERDRQEISGRPRQMMGAFRAFWAQGVEREADEVDWRGVSACAAREV
jgi:hypothetical protein